jgi:dUTP pyrophosphatase
MIKVKLIKLDEYAKVPEKSTDEAAGFDLFASSNGTIKVGKITKVQTSIAIEIPKGYFAFVRPRSGLASKQGITTSTSGVVDSDYRGELVVPLINLGEKDFMFYTGDRIAQMLILPVPDVEFVQEEKLSQTSRGSGGFGSTGS